MALKQDWKYDKGKTLNYRGKAEWPGICLSLSYDWCRRMLGGDVPRKKDFVDSEVGIAGQKAFRKYMRSDFRNGPFHWLQTLAECDSLVISRIAGTWRNGNFVSSTSPINNLQGDYAAILGIPGHALAFARHNGDIRFFDPNHGQYRHTGMPGRLIEDFLLNHYKECSPGNWELKVFRNGH